MVRTYRPSVRQKVFRAIRTAVGYSQEATNNKSGLGKHKVARYETGEHDSSVEDLGKMIAGLGRENWEVNSAELLDGDHIPYVPREYFPHDSPNAQRDYIPFYNIKALCSAFSEEEEPEVEGYVLFRHNAASRYFVVQAVGHCMEPKIMDGQYVVMSWDTAGSNKDMTVLVQHQSLFDPDTHARFSIKDYYSKKKWDEELQREVTDYVELVPKNKNYAPIRLTEGEYKIVGRFVCVL